MPAAPASPARLRSNLRRYGRRIASRHRADGIRFAHPHVHPSLRGDARRRGRRRCPPSARTIVDLGIGTGALSARCLNDGAARRGRSASTSIRRSWRWPGAGFGGRASLVDRLVPPGADAAPATRWWRPSRCTTSARGRRKPRSTAGSARRCAAAACSSASTASRRSTAPCAARNSTSGSRICGVPTRRREAKAILASWSHEDVYVPLDAELALLRSAGFRVELLWRRGAFAVIRAAR